MADIKTCPECSRSLREITIIDRAYRPVHQTVEYAAGDAERGVWLGRFPIEGRILGFVCDQCGRVLLYAQPKEG